VPKGVEVQVLFLALRLNHWCYFRAVPHVGLEKLRQALFARFPMGWLPLPRLAGRLRELDDLALDLGGRIERLADRIPDPAVGADLAVQRTGALCSATSARARRRSPPIATPFDCIGDRSARVLDGNSSGNPLFFPLQRGGLRCSTRESRRGRPRFGSTASFMSMCSRNGASAWASAGLRRRIARMSWAAAVMSAAYKSASTMWRFADGIWYPFGSLI
jgi:hypothetical protein